MGYLRRGCGLNSEDGESNAVAYGKYGMPFNTFPTMWQQQCFPLLHPSSNQSPTRTTSGIRVSGDMCFLNKSGVSLVAHNVLLSLI